MIPWPPWRTGLTAGSSRAFASASFDVAASFDVLYSLEDADERIALDEMYRILKPGGFAIINVAAMEALRGDHSVLSQEVRRYSRRTIGERLVRAGFTIVRLTYTNFTLLPPLLLARAWQRRRGLRATQHEIAVPSEPLNALFTGLLVLESTWVRWFDAPAGSSLLCLARKPT